MFPFAMQADTSMFSFSSSTSPYDEAVEKATSETQVSENWGLMMSISDSVSSEGAKGCKNVLLSIKKRLNNRDPHVIIFALSLLDCLWNNTGAEFRRAISSREFVPELSDKANYSVRAVAVKVREIVKKWAENECVKDASLSLISTLHKELSSDGFIMDSPKPKTVQISNDPNVVSSAEEEAALAKAIEASLRDAEQQKAKKQQTQKVSSAYPSLTTQALAKSGNGQKSYREVRALYDFEDVEENELPFKTGDIITVLEDSDPNWWKGQSHRGVGLFPSSFVTAKLETTPIQNKKEEPKTVEKLPVKIDQQILTRCIQLLDECDPAGERPDPPELAIYEEQAYQQGPLINKKLAAIDKQANMLANLDMAVRDVLASYDNALKEQAQTQQPPMQMNFPPIKSGVFPTMPGGPMALLQQYQMAQSQMNQMPNQYQPHMFANAPGMPPQQQQRQMATPSMIPQSMAPPSYGQPLNYPPQQQQPMYYSQQQQPLIQPQQFLQDNMQNGTSTPTQRKPMQTPQMMQQGSYSPSPAPVMPPQNVYQGHPTQIQTTMPVAPQPQQYAAPHPSVQTAPTQSVYSTISGSPLQHQQSVPPTPQHSDISLTHTSSVSVAPIPQQVQAPSTPVQQEQNTLPVAPIKQSVPPTLQQETVYLQQQQQPSMPTVAATVPIAPMPQQQPVQHESNQATVAPQRPALPVQPVEPQAEVHEEQLVSLDETAPSDPERPPAVDQQNLDPVPIMDPIPIAPQPSYENQHFIVPVQPQVQEPL
uniref:Signal transducing adapter molecule 1 n=2 Tax=Panagrolaimus sp. JU765 TaxID=591449 RepID=A0AC34PY24_9BILA